MPPTGRFLGLDIGGTSVKAGMVGPGEKRVGASKSLPTQIQDGPEVFLDRLCDYARSFGPFDAVGVGCPGVFDPGTGALRASANLQSLEGRILVQEIAQRLNLSEDQVRVDNDANLAAYGEQWHGAGAGRDNMCLLTLGTGIGGGLIQDGRLYTGPHGMASEVGHIVILPKEQGGHPCGCGSAGCLETLASATHVRRRAREAGLTEDTVELCRRAEAAAGPERELLHQVGRDLGRGMSYVVSLLDITFFVIAGGFSAALPQMIDGIHETLSERRYGTPKPDVVRATLGPDAGWMGAARLAWDFR
jgi:glucokinase